MILKKLSFAIFILKQSLNQEYFLGTNQPASESMQNWLIQPNRTGIIFIVKSFEYDLKAINRMWHVP